MSLHSTELSKRWEQSPGSSLEPEHPQGPWGPSLWDCPWPGRASSRPAARRAAKPVRGHSSRGQSRRGGRQAEAAGAEAGGEGPGLGARGPGAPRSDGAGPVPLGCQQPSSRVFAGAVRARHPVSAFAHWVRAAVAPTPSCGSRKFWSRSRPDSQSRALASAGARDQVGGLGRHRHGPPDSSRPPPLGGSAQGSLCCLAAWQGSPRATPSLSPGRRRAIVSSPVAEGKTRW